MKEEREGGHKEKERALSCLYDLLDGLTFGNRQGETQMVTQPSHSECSRGDKDGSQQNFNALFIFILKNLNCLLLLLP
jgi:hypothetical protein